MADQHCLRIVASVFIGLFFWGGVASGAFYEHLRQFEKRTSSNSTGPTKTERSTVTPDTFNRQPSYAGPLGSEGRVMRDPAEAHQIGGPMGAFEKQQINARMQKLNTSKYSTKKPRKRSF